MLSFPSLPVAASATGLPLKERADAARNRQRILEVATALIEERGIEHVSMADVAEAAQVGTGTLYRRFGDRAGLALALLDEHTRALQDTVILGPPPLGPGAPARDRLLAFGEAYLELMDRHGGLMVVAIATDPRARDSGASAFVLTHLRVLLAEAAPGLDGEYAAAALFQVLDPALHLQLREGRGWELERVLAGWRAFVARLCG
ncbi:MAG TPA: helix-turn-helix domain-containing protein [Solirubrobacteraceae bacterium]|nr:helix-turn-helix domain-containing protein [Solirubrobacteraceae bacterium]